MMNPAGAGPLRGHPQRQGRLQAVRHKVNAVVIKISG